MKLINALLLSLGTMVMPTLTWADPASGPVVLEEGATAALRERMVEAAVAKAEETHNSIIIRTRRGTDYEFRLEPPDLQDPNNPDLLLTQPYNFLKDEQKHKFHANRIWMLQKAATALDRQEISIGLVHYVQEKVRSLYGRKPSNPGITALRERGNNITRRLLESLDNRLWLEAHKLVNLNEVAFQGSINPTLFAGYRDRYVGGMIGLGFNWGFNRVSQAMTFEIYLEIEKLSDSLTPITFLPSISFRGGVNMISSVDQEDQTAVRNGTKFYPIGAPVYIQSTQNQVSAGLDMTATIPPLSNIQQYTTTHYEKPLIRITATRKQRGILRIYLGIPSQIKSICSRLLSKQE